MVNKEAYALPQIIGSAIYYMRDNYFIDDNLEMLNASTILNMLELLVINDAITKAITDNKRDFIPEIVKAYPVGRQSYAATGEAANPGLTIDTDKIEIVVRRIAVYQRWFNRPGCDITGWTRINTI
ncbi:uncharacterized protein LY79DRAFT_698777 [Colletotrichum navitas]|uniref:Uncharacterized protein n=1 Tax=Colletotrichum navitas TaxID=681940 RepID=A0AAD8QDE5_9PEZI|nr:uncharacterized protein LY79DRAFT_698777 [Colletotrichum navitas]KAK1600174.1 hypothetical protein LY79DRAFT_698777 [Colletotrichum navitas]